ncbi:hypothetical protein CMI42_05470 [Candidatus Pacearchaeota archaeon]|nr:hypothetical protein [Candidatus Pacearchaeota archaeon]|tara:strand:+ start:1873 stop:2472 length:600 start_codon:yes stop_codon:yes gene_type:complete
MFGFFSKKVEKTEFDQFKNSVQTGFNSAKKDIGDLITWVKHLNTADVDLKEEVGELNEELSTIKEELENLKNLIGVVGNKGVFKQASTVLDKQTPVYSVLNSVQTGVQTVFLDNLTTNERAIVFVLLNSDMKLSYEDLAAMMGKRKSTIRGQINSIKQKSEGLIEEVISENNKKRVFIPERVKEILLKKGKVRNKTKKR